MRLQSRVGSVMGDCHITRDTAGQMKSNAASLASAVVRTSRGLAGSL